MNFIFTFLREFNGRKREREWERLIICLNKNYKKNYTNRLPNFSIDKKSSNEKKWIVK